MSSPNSLSSNCMFSSIKCVFAKHKQGSAFEPLDSGDDLIFMQSSWQGGLAAGIDGV